jgi:diguanylate cyclase (GGDEF)-like protein
MAVDPSGGSYTDNFSRARILIIEDNEAMGDALLTSLTHSDYQATLAMTGAEGLAMLLDGAPFDLLLLDVMLPEIDGWAILSRIRSTPAMAQMPVIMLTAIASEQNEVEFLAAGADDYMSKPFSFDNLLAHIRALLRRSALRELNPLTGLPGNRPVERFLEQCANTNSSAFWAVAYIDIDHFKAYNDCYGFLKGDMVLKATAELLVGTAALHPIQPFVANIGGDDFLIGFQDDLPRTHPDAAVETTRTLERITSAFPGITQSFYTERDFSRGYIEAENRSGVMEAYPLMSLSIAVVTNARRVFSHPLEISTTFVSLKHKAKSIAGNSICFDQRRASKTDR